MRLEIQKRKKRTESKRSADFLSDIQQGYLFVRSSKLMRLWSIAAVLFSILWFSLLLPFSRLSAQQFPDANNLASFFGVFTGLQTGAALLLSLFVTNRLFARYGLINMLLIYPMIYFSGFAILVVFPLFPVVISARFTQLSWSQGVAEPAYQVSLNTVPDARRDQVRAFIAAVPAQAGVIISGILLAVGDQALSQQQLYLIGLVTAVLCTLNVWRAKAAYRGALEAALLRGQPHVFSSDEIPFGGFPHDPASLDVVSSGLQSPDPGIRRLCVEILGQMVYPVHIDRIVAMLGDTDRYVRLASLQALTTLKAVPARTDVKACLSDPVPEIRIQATISLNALAEGSLELLEPLRKLLDDPDLRVRVCAANLLARAGDPTMVHRVLLPLAKGSDAGMRRQALLALGEYWAASDADTEVIVQAISAGLSDPVASVRRAAADAIQTPTPAFTQMLIPVLGDENDAVRAAAAAAIGRIGGPALEQTLAALDEPELEAGALLALERLSTDESADMIRAYLAEKVQKALRDEALGFSFVPNGEKRLSLLVESLHWRAEEQATLAMRAAGLLGDRETVKLGLDNLQSQDPEQRAYALEILDTIREAPTIRPLFSLWEPDATQPSSSNSHWQAVLEHEDSWVRLCAAFAAKQQTDPQINKSLERMQHNDPNDLVRVTATLLGGDELETLQTLTFMERIVFLRGVPLFVDFPPADLMQVASIATERYFPDGAVITSEGDIGDEMYIIVSGDVRVIADPDIELAVRKPGEYVGEIAIISREPRIATLVASGEVRTLCIDQRQFEGILRERPATSLAVIRVLSNRLKEIDHGWRDHVQTDHTGS